MPQGTVKHFNPETRTGTLLLDSKEELEFSAPVFHAAGLMELRIGQRVRLELEGSGEDKRVTSIHLVSL